MPRHSTAHNRRWATPVRWAAAVLLVLAVLFGLAHLIPSASRPSIGPAVTSTTPSSLGGALGLTTQRPEE